MKWQRKWTIRRQKKEKGALASQTARLNGLTGRQIAAKKFRN
jgi:hypothetical protein